MKNPYPTKETVRELSSIVNESENKVSTWFKHYR